MEFITDRTEADVLLGTAKGQYSYTDLNRVENAVAQLLELVKPLDIYLELVTKNDWKRPEQFSVSEWPTESQMVRYLQNVITLCEALQVPHSAVPHTMEELTCRDANAIEAALQNVYYRVQSIIQTYKYSGELIAGEEVPF